PTARRASSCARRHTVFAGTATWPPATNARTGGVYGDLGLFTSRESFGADLSELFDFVEGGTRPRAFRHLLLAPGDLREGAHRAHPPRGRRGQRGGREDRRDRARHLLPEARAARPLVDDPRDL